MKAKLTGSGVPIFCKIEKSSPLVYEKKENGMAFTITEDTKEDRILDLVLTAMEQFYPDTNLREAFKWSIEIVEYLIEQQKIQIEESNQK